MKTESLLEHYCEHGIITSPGLYYSLLQKLPVDIIKLCKSINRLTLIDLLPNMGIVSVPHEHLNDINIRGIEGKLKEIINRDGSNLINLRSDDKLLLGNCRDLSLILCSALRSHRIPARVRSGFGTFFVPGKYFDHWLCEYWNDVKARWIKVDPWMAQVQNKKDALPMELFEGLLKLNYNPYDVKNEYFIAGGQAWINCRENGHSSEDYRTYEDHLKGLWFVRDNMIRDLLCLNKLEPLPWDCWGFMGIENNNIKSEELVLLDEIARFLSTEEFRKTTLGDRLKGLKLESEIMESLS